MRYRLREINLEKVIGQKEIYAPGRHQHCMEMVRKIGFSRNKKRCSWMRTKAAEVIREEGGLGKQIKIDSQK